MGVCAPFSVVWGFCGYKPVMWGLIVRSLNPLTVKEVNDFCYKLVPATFHSAWDKLIIIVAIVIILTSGFSA